MNLSSQRVWCYLCECEVFIHNQTNRFHQRTNSLDSNEARRIFQYQQEFYDRGVAGEAPSISSSDYDEEEFDYQGQLNGLVGLKNIANTCYMNSALQALSNSPPLTGYFLECGNVVQGGVSRSKVCLSKSYLRLIRDLWLNKRRGYIVPDEIIRGISTIHPMFRGYQQHDTQEFLRCFMDQLHEELKEVKPPPPEYTNAAEEDITEESPCPSPSSQSEAEYETCDSGVSEQSSLSDEVTEPVKRIRKISRSPSPNQRHNMTVSSSSIPTMGSSVMSNRTNSNNSLASQSGNQQSKESAKKSNAPPKVVHRSIISDVFDGKLLSSVQCLTCDRVSTREETFQDLSLPIPGRDHVAVVHQPPPPFNITTNTNINGATCTDVVQVQDSWIWWLWSWFRSFFWGPAVNLHDCMAAFFSADELKGDNMYSCEKCNKLRNGLKFSRVLALPEMLCVHLKRFRHDLSYSSKISSPVIFPLTGLDMRQYLHKDCKSKVSTYDLSAVICHHGTVGSGHYICYAKHAPSDKWFEYDDQTVTQVSAETVQNCEAYVLFYQKSNPQMSHIRAQAQEIMSSHLHVYPSSSDIKFFVSKQWINRFNTFAEPGPIDNSSILCQHGSLLPNKAANVSDLLVPVNQTLWDYMYEKFGGGPVCNHPIECDTCKTRAEDLERRQTNELRLFSDLRDEFQYNDNSSMLFAISMSWFRKWQAFARGETDEDPGPISNMSIAQQSESLPIRNVRQGSDYAQINLRMWKFFFNIYGGGPEIILRGASEFSKSEREAELVDTTENLSLHDEPEEVILTAEQTKPLENEEKSPVEKETTSILKPVKTVSFEDADDDHSEANDKVLPDEKVVTKTVPIERHPEPSTKKSKKSPRPTDSIGREKRHHRSTDLFGAEGNIAALVSRFCISNHLLFLGTIRYIPDEEVTSGSQQKSNQKPKRNGAESDSDDDVSPLASEVRVNGHGHHRSGRKKSKSVRSK